MIQRIQSIYYLLSGVCVAASAWCAGMSAANRPTSAYTESLRIDAFGVAYNQSAPTPLSLSEKHIPITVLVFFTALMAFIAIFMYANRAFQLRLGKTLITLCVGSLAAYCLIAFMATNQYMHGQPWQAYYFVPNAGMALLAAALIFAALANKAVKADENLVRSADRIR